MKAKMEFPHRRNRDGTYDSICPACLATVATAQTEAELRARERVHLCDPVLVDRFSSLAGLSSSQVRGTVSPLRVQPLRNRGDSESGQ